MNADQLPGPQVLLVFTELLRRFRDIQATDNEAAWDLLCAAHIVGQADFRMHCRVHWAMLLFAAKTRDGCEVLGQLFRLGLVPMGHLFQRLPLGNIGRANVSAFQSMSVAPKLAELIRMAKNKGGIRI